MSNRLNYNYNYSASCNISSSVTQSSSANPSTTGTTKRFTETITSNNRDGTSIRRTREESGRPTVQEETYIPPAGRISGTGTGTGTGTDTGTGTGTDTATGSGSGSGSGRWERGRIEDVTDDVDQAERDRLYEERMEDEYAKREGGA